MMKSIQDIFQGKFFDASSVVVQKMHRSEDNIGALRRNFTEHWPALTEPHDLVVVVVEGGRQQAAEQALQAFADGPRGTRYPTIVAAWQRAWENVTPFFVFPPDQTSGA